MDVKCLILLVRDRREIYAPQEAKHRDRNFIGSLWKEIAEELDTDFAKQLYAREEEVEESTIRLWSTKLKNHMAFYGIHEFLGPNTSGEGNVRECA
jgi:hypothetical protein